VQRFQDKADIASIGLEMGGCVIAGYFIGSWIDGRFDLAPWGTVVFLLFGFGAAVKGLWRVGQKARIASAATDAAAPRPMASRRFREARRPC
jgi:F0F1-type ATP synthase assembly protein I